MNNATLPASARAESPKIARIARAVTVEHVLWLVLILVAIWTRFWDLGYRAQHHDESLHSYYSWLFATGERLYVHHPLMHGPFLFHANALIYKLFGDNDTTSRLIPALFGVAIVAMPWLLRSKALLGRWGALAASFMLLISPAMLYYTRYIRHDPYMVAGCLLLAIAVFRYLENPQRRWIVVAFGTVAFLLANHELVLATFLIMCVVLWGSLLLTHLKPLIPVHAVTLILLGVSAWLWMDHPWPPIPWSRPATSALNAEEALVFIEVGGPVVLALIGILAVIALVKNEIFAMVGSIALAALAAIWLFISRDLIPAVPQWNVEAGIEENTFLTTSEFYWGVFQHPFVQAVLIIASMFLIGCFITVRWMLNGKQEEEDGLDYVLGNSEPNSVSYGVMHALRDPVGLGIGVLTGLLIWVVLYTTWFTNPAGIGTGTYETNGTLLYWLGQHDVQRGNQPWFYFIIIGLQYEWLTVVLAAAGSILISWRLIRWIFGGDHGPNLLWNVFIVAWFAGMLLVLSWAGEKMPWLIMHIILPATLVGAWVINTVVEGAIAWYRRQEFTPNSASKYGMIGLFAGLVVLAISWFFLSARLTWGEWLQSEESGWSRVVPEASLDEWWKIALPPLIALVFIAAAIWIIGSRKTIYTTLAVTVALMSMFQVHAGFRMAFIDGDIAIDTLIYNTVSPDVPQFVDDMEELSQIEYGDDSISIWYDSCSMQWPMNWYLNDFSNARFSTYTETIEADVFVFNPARASECGQPDRIPGFTKQEYVLLWHESESSVYRNFAIAPELSPGSSAWKFAGDPHDLGAIFGSVIDSLEYATTPEGQQKLFRLVAYRDQTEPLMSSGYPMTVWVRNDLLPQYNEVRYGENHP